MTYEEAKIQIQAIPEKIWDQLSEPDREAMEMAFSALQAQDSPKPTAESAQNVPKEDLISRKVAIDALDCINGTEEVLRSLPSAQPEPCKDAVSREAAIDVAENAFVRGLLASPDIRKLPSVQPKPQWIPVSERLPEELEAVIITWKNHEPEPYYSDIKHKPFIGVGIYHREKWWWWSAYAEDMLAEYGDSKADRMDEAIEVTAWMPLPDPYRAERRTDDANDIT